MIVCHCRRVSEVVIDAVVAGGAQSVEDVASACGAGGRCGSCVPVIESMLACVEHALAADVAA